MSLRRSPVVGLLAFAVFLVACGGDGTDAAEAPDAPLPATSPATVMQQPPPTTLLGAGPETTGAVTPAPAAPRSPADPAGTPDVDLSQRIVELEDVHFDLFDGTSISLDRAPAELRRALLDAIRPLDFPDYDEVGEGDWLEPTDLVIGYEAAEGAFAFPHKILNFHEIVNDEFDGIPVLVSYCPLCRSGVVFDRRLDGATLDFSNTSALYDSDLVMVDRQTGSYWWQVPGRAIVGTLAGRELEVLPAVTTTWADWKERHPETSVLSRNTGSAIDYTRDPFVGYGERVDAGQFAFPVSPDARDDRLSPGTLVLGVEAGGEQRVYPIEQIAAAAVNDVVGGTPLVVFIWEGGAAAYSRVVDGATLTFSEKGGVLEDDETGSTWDRSGSATDGALVGSRLEALPARSTFWFAYVGAFPDAGVYRAATAG